MCCNEADGIALFQENAEQEYLWDGNDKSQYYRLRTTPGDLESNSFVPNPFYSTQTSKNHDWKYIPLDLSDKVNVENAENATIRFDENFVAVESLTVGTDYSEFSIENISLTLNSDSPGNSTSIIHTSSSDSLACNGDTLNIFGAPVQVLSLAIISVVDSLGEEFEASIDEVEIQRRIREIYSPVGVNFEEIDFFTEVVDYDLNGDDSVSVEIRTSQYFPEVDIAVSYVYDSLNYTDEYDGVILLFDKTKKYYSTSQKWNTYGIWTHNTQVGVVFMDNSMTPFDFSVKTMCHEAGHGLFNLDHPWHRYDYKLAEFDRVGFRGVWRSEEDPDNLMGYNPRGKSINRIIQCRKIHLRN
jgi:hypothetical protein